MCLEEMSHSALNGISMISFILGVSGVKLWVFISIRLRFHFTSLPCMVALISLWYQCGWFQIQTCLVTLRVRPVDVLGVDNVQSASGVRFSNELNACF